MRNARLAPAGCPFMGDTRGRIIQSAAHARPQRDAPLWASQGADPSYLQRTPGPSGTPFYGRCRGPPSSCVSVRRNVAVGSLEFHSREPSVIRRWEQLKVP